MNIYVGNLSYSASEDDPREVFGAFVKIESVKIIKDNHTGRSRGFGFVEMPSDAESQRAIDGVSGKDLKGREVKANKARLRSEGRRRGGGRGMRY